MVAERAPRILIVPGYTNSGPNHWQSLWQAQLPNSDRIQVSSWDEPERPDWVAAIERSVAASPDPVIAVTHSLGCLALAFWAEQTQLTLRGALIVAPPNPDGPIFPVVCRGFSPPPRQRLPFPNIVVYSDNDPYGSAEYARECIAAWGSQAVALGNAGHINAKSNLGDWPAGRALLAQL